MRVLHVLPTRAAEYGGPVVVAEEMVRDLRDQGVTATIYPPADDREYGLVSDLRRVRPVAQQLAQSDLVHIHGLWHFCTTAAARAARARRIPYIVTPHGMLDRWALSQSKLKKRTFGLLFERRNLAHASALHFFNDEEFEEAGAYGIAAPAFILPNGVRAERYTRTPARAAFDEQYPQCKGKTLALFLGRLHPKKGFDILLPALRMALARVPGLHLVVAGGNAGSYAKILRAIITENDLESRVTFTGFVHGASKVAALAAADFFVLPSHQEGDSVAIKEAMASGLPVIITTACHFGDVAPARAGLVIKDDVAQLSQALVTLGTDPALRAEMGANAARLIDESYTWSKVVKRLVDIYADTVGGKFTSRDWVRG